MKRLVSFRKLKISSSLVFLKLLVWSYFGQVCLNLSVYENVFDCEGYFVCWAYWGCIWSSYNFCHLSSMNWMSATSAFLFFFLQHCLLFHFHVDLYDLVSRWELCNYFWKECSFCQGVLWWEGLMYFCSVELGGLIWSLSGWKI